MLGTYASLAMVTSFIPGAPLALGALGLVALGRSGVSAAVQAFTAEHNPLISSPLENMQDEDLNDDELNADNAAEWAADDVLRAPSEELEKSASSNSRELLTNAPTPSPTQVINCNPSGTGSFLGALTNARNSGGVLPVTIGTSAIGCNINLNTNINSVSSIITIDVAGTGSTGFTIGSGYSYIFFTGSNPVGLNITSSSGTGSITFGSDLCLYQNGAGIFNFIVGSGLTSTFSNGASIFNSAGSNVNIYVKSNGTMIWKDQSYIYNSAGGITTNVDSGGALIMSNGGYFMHQGAGAGIANIQGLLSMDKGNGKSYNTAFYFMKVIVGSNGTLVSGVGGSAFMSSASVLANGTHQVAIGSDDYVVQLGVFGPITSNATLGGLLNLVSYRSLASLQGNNFTIWKANPGNKISGQYSALKFNGSDINLPYNIFYTKENVTVFFPTFSPTTSPSSLPRECLPRLLQHPLRLFHRKNPQPTQAPCRHWRRKNHLLHLLLLHLQHPRKILQNN